MSTITCRFLLKGEPGVGKTTLVNKIIEELKETNIPLKGFYTLEIRNAARKRVGFDLKSVIDNSSKPLARVESSGAPSKYKVGQYTVYPENIDSFALPLIEDFQNTRGVIIIDEIGKMESFSKILLKQIAKLIFNSNSIIIATCNAVGKPLPLVENIQLNSKCRIIQVNQNNRNNLMPEIIREIKLNFNQHSLQ